MAQESLDQWRDENGDGGTATRSGNTESGTERSDPRRCLSFTVSGPWGHFRRIEGNIVKQTYRIIPRTTVAGLTAAILGIGRDDYYDTFAQGRSWVAIEPTAPLQTVNMPMNTLSTANEDLASLNSRGKISVKLPDPTKLRQQHNYEVLTDPAYRIDLALGDDEVYQRLREMLAAGKSYYVPSLGLSEHLAEIEFHGEFKVEDGAESGVVDVDSAVPNAVDDVVPSPESRCQVEESPAFMQRDEGGRTTTKFTSYAYNPDAEPLSVRGIETSVVDGRRVVFV